MKVKMVVRRYPFYTVYCSVSEYVRPFEFEPRLFGKELTSQQEREFGEYLTTIVEELKEMKEIYESVKQKINVKYIEVYKEITINEEQLKKIIEYAEKSGLELKPYAMVLPLTTEEQFNELRKYAEKHGYAKAISKFLKP